MIKVGYLLISAILLSGIHDAVLCASQDTLKFAWITDLHFGRTEEAGETLYPAEWLHQAIENIESKGVDFFLVGGDMIETSGDQSQMDQFDEAMITHLPWYPMPGNHDIGDSPESITIEKINHWIQRGYGRGEHNREFYGINIPGLAVIYVLNTVAPLALDSLVLCRAEIQLAEMDSLFTAHAEALHKIVCGHIPLFTQSASEEDASTNIPKFYRDQLIAMMKKHGSYYYLAGHRHLNETPQDSGITVITTTALSFQLGSEKYRGFRIFTVTPDTLMHRFRPLSPEGYFGLDLISVGQGKVYSDPQAPYFEAGSSVRLLADPDPGWIFHHWKGDLTGSSSCTSVIMNSEKNVEAVFVEHDSSFKLNLHTIGEGQVVAEPYMDLFPYGTEVTLSTVSEAGWQFFDWSGSARGVSASQTLIMNSHKSVLATFIPLNGSAIDLYPNHDSYIRGGFMFSGTNFNTDSVLIVQEGSSDIERIRTYIQFGLSTVHAPVLESALFLTGAGISYISGVQTSVDVYYVDNDDWDESTLTWKNAPEAVSLLDSQSDIRIAEDVYFWNTTGALQSESIPDSLLTFELEDGFQLGRKAEFHSRESSSSPILRVITETVNHIDSRVTLPTKIELRQNHPNPFNPSTTIEFDLPVVTDVRIMVHDISGQEVIQLLNQRMEPGYQHLVWDGRDHKGRMLPSGIYIVLMQTPEYHQSIKLVKLK